MKKQIGILFFVFLGLFPAHGQSIKFFEGTWAESLAEAKANNKLIFVDAYASWCGPCKRMAATVFTQKKVGDYFNERFLNFKIDMEKGEGPAFGRKYPVRAFPTLLFIDYDGTLVHRQVGAQGAGSLLALGQQALAMVDRSGPLAEKYGNGDRSPALVYQYIAALNQAGKSSLRIANDFLRSEPDWNEQ
jgi:thiol-disulfide isomerase/thioredoxin